MRLVVFAQESAPFALAFDVVAKARAHFDVDVVVTDRVEAGGTARATLRLATKQRAFEARVVARRATEADHALADLREAGARGAGLAALARRCGGVWEVDAPDGPDAFLVAAVLASAALGPVVTDDGMFGVRGARERWASSS